MPAAIRRITKCRISQSINLTSVLSLGEQALTGERKSLPSLVMVSRDLTKIIKDRYSAEPTAKSYLDHLQALVQASNLRQRH